MFAAAIPSHEHMQRPLSIEIRVRNNQRAAADYLWIARALRGRPSGTAGFPETRRSRLAGGKSSLGRLPMPVLPKCDRSRAGATRPVADIGRMREKRSMSMLALLCRFVDWDLRRKPIITAGNLTLLIGMLPWFALVATDGREGSPIRSAPMIVAITFDLLWFSFVGWRAWLLIRQAAERGDRLYDRKGKFLLPPEYTHTESATKARRRRGNVR